METKRRYGIVTQTKYYNFVNFGAMLQCYALQQALNKLGVDNTVVDYRTDPLQLTDIDDPLKRLPCLRQWALRWRTWPAHI